MARISVDLDQIYTDIRFQNLSDVIGSKTEAVGLLISLWRTAQSFWFKNELVPFHVWDCFEHKDLLLKFGYADKRNEGVYIRGSKENFQWYFDKKPAFDARNKLGGLSRSSTAIRDKKGRMMPASDQPDPAPIPISISIPISNKEIRKKEEGIGFPAKAVNTASFIGAYVNAYKKRYGTAPEINGFAAGTAKRIVRDLGIQKACELVQVYLQVEDVWFKKMHYDLFTFEKSLNKISLALNTGQQPSDLAVNNESKARREKLRKDLGQ